MLQTVTDNLQEMVDEIVGLLENLLLNHSQIHLNLPSRSGGYGRQISTRAMGNFYEELSEEGRQLQSKLHEDYNRYYALLSALLADQPQDTSRRLEATHKLVDQIIQHQRTYKNTTQDVLDEAIKTVQSQMELVRRLYDPTTGEYLFIPDTNALLYNPNIEKWSFVDDAKFTIVLLPTVLSELDELKISHRNEQVRKKSEKLIRQIKEYCRRGRLTEGVTIVAGAIDLIAVATEPKEKTFLPWLDSENADDRILASTLEVMRARPRGSVYLVTRDINLQNKAEYARIPFVEPPASISI